MNKLLEELSHEAREYAMGQNYTGYGPVGFYEHYTQKLTDLIVGRCIHICVMSQPIDTTELKCATRIKEYFYDA
jgi:hypothetical protein